MFKHLVVALDGSPGAMYAFDVALALAKAEGAKVSVCSVADPSLTAGSAPTDLVQSMVSDERHRAGQVVDEALRAASAADVAAEGCVLSGQPVYEIVRYSEKEGADAIVVGTHGRAGLDRLRMGSVAEGVMLSAPAPVISVRAAAGHR
jgi:nucleotide-binding universal stress UspA family protein